MLVATMVVGGVAMVVKPMVDNTNLMVGIMLNTCSVVLGVTSLLLAINIGA